MAISILVNESLDSANIVLPKEDDIEPWLGSDILEMMSSNDIDESLAESLDEVFDQLIDGHSDIQIDVPDHFPMAEYDALSRHVFTIEGPGFD